MSRMSVGLEVGSDQDEKRQARAGAHAGLRTDRQAGGMAGKKLFLGGSFVF